jgi:hypothetical protein
LEHGLKSINIHKILSFRQSQWLKEYIDLNTLRKNARFASEKTFFKLMNNPIFGKCLEDKRKRRDVRLFTTWWGDSNILGRVKIFIFKSLRVESMDYCFKSPQPKFQT